MFGNITRNWWTFALRGVVAVIFGVTALIWPEQMMQALVLVFGVYALVDGTLTIATGIASVRYFKRWWALLLEGISGILIGMLAFFLPDVTALALVYFIAAWALITGIFEIVTALQLRREIAGEWRLILSGLLSISLSVLLFVFPIVGKVSLVWLIGIYAIFFGITMIILAFRLRSLWRKFENVIKSRI